MGQTETTHHLPGCTSMIFLQRRQKPQLTMRKPHTNPMWEPLRTIPGWYSSVKVTCPGRLQTRPPSGGSQGPHGRDIHVLTQPSQSQPFPADGAGAGDELTAEAPGSCRPEQGQVVSETLPTWGTAHASWTGLMPPRQVGGFGAHPGPCLAHAPNSWPINDLDPGPASL